MALRLSLVGAVRTALLGAALALAGTTAGSAQVAPLNPPQKVKIAYVPIMKFATMYVAASRGLFKKYGLDVEVEQVKSGTEAIAFLTQGSIDVGGIAIVTSLWNSWNQGMDVRIIAPGGLEPFKDSPTMLVLRKDLADSGKVKTPADLKGMKIAIAGGPGSGGEYLVAKALERGKLTIRDVELINLANPDMPAALQNRSIDAALTGSPYADQVIKGGSAVAFAKDLTPGLMTVAFVASGKFLKERPDAAERVVLAMTEAARLMQGADYLSKENMAAYLTHVASTEAAIRDGSPVVYDPNMVIPTADLGDTERVFRENGRTTYTTPLDLAKVVDDRFAKKAIQALGEKK